MTPFGTMYKDTHTYQYRRRLGERFRRKHPGKVPVIVEKSPKARIGSTHTKKYLIPFECTFGHLYFLVRKQLDLRPEVAVILSVKNAIPSSSTTIGSVYLNYHDSDLMLYVTYQDENVYGGEVPPEEGANDENEDPGHQEPPLNIPQPLHNGDIHPLHQALLHDELADAQPIPIANGDDIVENSDDNEDQVFHGELLIGAYPSLPPSPPSPFSPPSPCSQPSPSSSPSPPSPPSLPSPPDPEDPPDEPQQNPVNDVPGPSGLQVRIPLPLIFITQHFLNRSHVHQNGIDLSAFRAPHNQSVGQQQAGHQDGLLIVAQDGNSSSNGESGEGNNTEHITEEENLSDESEPSDVLHSSAEDDTPEQSEDEDEGDYTIASESFQAATGVDDRAEHFSDDDESVENVAFAETRPSVDQVESEEPNDQVHPTNQGTTEEHKNEQVANENDSNRGTTEEYNTDQITTAHSSLGTTLEYNTDQITTAHSSLGTTEEHASSINEEHFPIVDPPVHFRDGEETTDTSEDDGLSHFEFELEHNLINLGFLKHPSDEDQGFVKQEQLGAHYIDEDTLGEPSGSQYITESYAVRAVLREPSVDESTSSREFPEDENVLREPSNNEDPEESSANERALGEPSTVRENLDEKEESGNLATINEHQADQSNEGDIYDLEEEKVASQELLNEGATGGITAFQYPSEDINIHEGVECSGDFATLVANENDYDKVSIAEEATEEY